MRNWRASARDGGYDVLVLSLPAPEGVALCGSLPCAGSGLPILLLRDSATVEEVVAGLNAGADDYLAGPLALRELAARLRALARRHRLNLHLAAQQAG
jgi:DNA-binding response OmpR family regulator